MARVHDQPVPVIAVAVSAAGKVAVTVTGALVALPPLFVAVRENCAPVCPFRKNPGGAMKAVIVISGS